MNPGALHVQQEGNVLVATIENPPFALMDLAIVEALAALVTRADNDPDIGGVVLVGSHPSRFLAHYDVRELLETAQTSPSLSPRWARRALKATASVRRVPGGDTALKHSPAAGLWFLERLAEVLSSIQRSSAVWVAAINGSAMGGGCEVALACDVRIATAGDFAIGQPEIMLGFAPGGGATQRLTRMLGTRLALRVVLEGRPYSPAEALELGIVDQVVDVTALMTTAVGEASRLGSRPKTAIGAAKRAVYESASESLTDGLRSEAAEFLSALGSQEAQAAMAAYVAATEHSGDLPAYDPAQVDRALAAGRFVPGPLA